MQMIRRLFHRQNKRPAVAISIAQDRILLASREPEVRFDQEPCNGPADWARAIAALVQRTQAAGAPVRVLLPTALYQQVQIEKPDVPDDELPGALPWAVKDLVSEPVLQLGFDYYQLPANPASRPRLAVICVGKPRLQQIANAVNKVAELQQITIEELGLVDLLGALPQLQLLLFQSPGQDLQLLAVCQGQLCFSRQLRGFSRLAQQTIDNLDADLLDNLSLEVQRSIDYLVAQLKLPAASQIYVAIATPDLGGVIRHLAANFSVPVQALANPAVTAGLEYLPLFGNLQVAEVA